MELFDIVDEYGNPTGETVERSLAHANGIRHRTVHIWIARKRMGKWQVLLQKRAKTKDSFPGKYDTSSAGHIQAGDEPLESAIRELEEELGITAAPDELQFAGRIQIQFEKEFHNKLFKDNEVSFVYVYLENVEIDEISVQEEELESVEWFDLEETYKECLAHNLKFCVPLKGLETVRKYLRKTESGKDELCAEIEALEKKVHFYEAALNALPNPVFLKDDQLKFVFFNNSYKDFFGLEDGDFIGMEVTELSYLTSEERVRYHEEDSKVLKESSSVHYESSFPKDDNPRESLYWSKGFSTFDNVKGIIGEIVDISRLKRLEEELQMYVRELKLSGRQAELEAMIDPTTKLYNRRILDEYVPNIVKKYIANNSEVWVYVIDLDYFKQINDTYGHHIGDMVLHNFAKTLKESVRQDDIVIRYGGDEFLMILPGMVEASAMEKAEQIIDKVRKTVLTPDRHGVSISVGVASFGKNHDTSQAVRNADSALYRAKKEGRGVARIYVDCQN